MARDFRFSAEADVYRGRLAPTPSGLLHAGHARTFWIAWHRSRQFKGSLIFRNEDLDPLRCKANLAKTALEDMRWLDLSWEEGPDIGGPHAPYDQSARTKFYQSSLKRLAETGLLFPCARSRKELNAYRELNGQNIGEPIYPEEWRPRRQSFQFETPEVGVVWRFRVPSGRVVAFVDQCLGEMSFVAGEDFGDFVVWRRDGVPAYELAVVVDDIEMGITEVVRGEDLLLSTARQILLYEALGCYPPEFFHCPLLRDGDGNKLSKSLDSISITDHRASGADPAAWAKDFTRVYNSL